MSDHKSINTSMSDQHKYLKIVVIKLLPVFAIFSYVAKENSSFQIN